MENWSDSLLFSAIREGNENALSILFIRYNTYLVHYGLRVLPERTTVEDCIQDLFVYLFESGKRIGEVRNVKAYLFKSLRRRITKVIQRESKRKQQEQAVDIRFAKEDMALQAEQGQLVVTLVDALNNLPWRQREAVYLRYYNGLSTKEIAEIMGIANQTVLNTLHQAIKKLRKHDKFLVLTGLILLLLLLNLAHL